MNLSKSLPRRSFYMLISLSLLALLVPDSVWARGERPDNGRGSNTWQAMDHGPSRQDLSLHDRQKVSIVRQLVSDALTDKFFTNELALKLVMAKAVSNDPYFDAKEFTDLLLNILSDSAKVIVVNQDLKLDLNIKMDLVLMHYESAEVTRRRGQFLGADYLVTSRVSSRTELNAKGKPERFYVADLRIEGVRSDKLYLKKSVIHKVGAVKRRNH